MDKNTPMGRKKTHLCHLSSFLSQTLSEGYPTLSDLIPRISPSMSLPYVRSNSDIKSDFEFSAMFSCSRTYRYLPFELGSLTLLETLFLFKNSFIGEIPVSFSKLGALKFLDLSDNRLSRMILEGFSSLKELTILHLMDNKLTSEIPDRIGELPNLQELHLWNNSLSGNLPHKLGSNAKLQRLDVSSKFELAEWSDGLRLGNRLARLILFSNKFDSEIPPILANCSSLWRLRIQDNRFTSAIPPGFSLLSNLTYMDLSMNNFSGEISRDLSDAVRLELRKGIGFISKLLAASKDLLVLMSRDIRRRVLQVEDMEARSDGKDGAKGYAFKGDVFSVGLFLVASLTQYSQGPVDDEDCICGIVIDNKWDELNSLASLSWGKEDNMLIMVSNKNNLCVPVSYVPYSAIFSL